MKICYLGDANIQVRLVSEHFRRQGHDVHLCTFRPRKLEGIPVHRLLSGPIITKARFLTALPRLRRLLEELRPDVVHAFYVSSYGFLGSCTAPERLVISAMGTDVLLGPRWWPWNRWLVRRAFSRCRRILSVAPHLSEEILRFGADAAKVTTFLRGVDSEPFERAALPAARRKPVVLCVRKLEPLYNHKLLIDAAPEILSARSDVRFVLCGDGYLRHRLMRRAEGLGVLGAFDFLGDVPHPQLAELLGSSAVYFSGAISDGTSVSLLEAMAAGAFPIVADIPANHAWIPSRERGRLVPPTSPRILAETVIDALSRPEMREAAAKSNQEMIRERASWKEGMLRLEAIYREVSEGASDARFAEIG